MSLSLALASFEAPKSIAQKPEKPKSYSRNNFKSLIKKHASKQADFKKAQKREAELASIKIKEVEEVKKQDLQEELKLSAVETELLDKISSHKVAKLLFKLKYTA
jgi:hypothetical protein